MRKILWAVAALALSFSAAQAQEAKMSVPSQTEGAAPKKMVRDPEIHAHKMADKMTAKLNLSTSQNEQIYAAFLEQFKQIDVLREAGDAKGKARAIREQTDAKLKTILGEEKYEQYQSYRKEVKEKRQNSK